jgi:hypothetical protein
MTMFDRTPSAVDVTIGGETRLYEAVVTTAPRAVAQTLNGHAGGIELRESCAPYSGADHVRRHARPYEARITSTSSGSCGA